MMNAQQKGTASFMGMALIGLFLCVLFAVGAWLLADVSNADYIAPMPTPYHDDQTSDILTIAEPVTITAEMEHVAIADEITDLARDVSDNQKEQARDAVGAVASVAVAGYAANTAIVGSFAFRDIAILLIVVAVLFLIWQIKKSSNKRGE